LTPRALAFWLSGDGAYDKRDGVVTICSDNFTPEEVEHLRSVLLENCGIESTRILAGNPNKSKYRIRIPKREIAKLQNIVADLIPSSMRSRVGL
jgi:hypothetical protein